MHTFRWPQDVERARRLLPDLSAFQKDHPDVDMYACGGLLSLSQYRYLYSLVDAFVPQEARVLDWGCGHGHFSFYLVSAGYRNVSAFSLDPEPALLREAALRFPGRLKHRQGSADDPVRLPYADAAFDAVLSVGVLEHVRETGGDERRSLRELRRVLRPGGTLIVDHFPNRWSLIEFLARALTSQYTHPHRFTPRDIRALCRDAGFDLQLVRTYAFLPRNVWRRFPERLRNSPRLARLFNRVDAAFERTVPLLCENHLFVARKPPS